MDITYVNNNFIPRNQIELLQGSGMHITLWKDSSTWKIKDHTESTPSFVALSDQNAYEIPKNMQFRAICPDNRIDSADTYVIHYDKKFRDVIYSDILETFTANQLKQVWPYRILLDSSTTATLIHIHG
jgi:hypothetical protein